MIDDFSNRFAPERKEALIAEVEAQVLKWLKDEKADAVLDIRFTGANNNPIYGSWLQFSKGVMYVRTCANRWDAWAVAESSQWPRLISHCLGNIGSNSADLEVHPPNEFLTDNYDNKLRRFDGENIQIVERYAR